MKDEALKLASQLDGLNSCEPVIIKACEDMIRRLVEELEFQKKANIDLLLKNTYSNRTIELLQQDTPQTKPLSDEEILHIYNESYRNTLMGIDPLVFAREIEERHGIK